MRTILILFSFILCSCAVHAQEILPTELFQIYRTWRLRTPQFDKSTYEYVKTVDSNWELRAEPTKDADGRTMLMGFQKNKAWYKDDQHGLLLTESAGPNPSRALVYMFTNVDNWKRYQRQMQLMEAKVIDSGQKDGGTSTSYMVSDIFISLKEFPPGMNGEERQYQVLLTQQ